MLRGVRIVVRNETTLRGKDNQEINIVPNQIVDWETQDRD